MNTQESVREILRNLGTASASQIRSMLGQTDKKGGCRIQVALCKLKQKGLVSRVSPGTYSYIETKTVSQESEILRKIWRAVRASRRFTRKDILLLVGGNNPCLINQYITHLLKSGYLVSSGTGAAVLYQLTEKATVEVPPWKMPKTPEQNQAAWTQVEEKAWELVRLLLAGMGKGSKAKVKEAAKLIKQAAGKL